MSISTAQTFLQRPTLTDECKQDINSQKLILIWPLSGTLPQLYYRDNMAILLNRISTSHDPAQIMRPPKDSSTRVSWPRFLEIMTHCLLDTL